MSIKRCKDCKRTPLEVPFYRHPATRDGLSIRCCDCSRQVAKAIRAANADKLREYERTRSQNPERKEMQADVQRMRRFRRRAAALKCMGQFAKVTIAKRSTVATLGQEARHGR